MINRLLIRIKTVQLVYACLQSEEPRIFADGKLRESLEASQKLYNYLLALIVKVTDYRRQQILAAKSKYMPTREELNPNTRFVDNKLALMIACAAPVGSNVAVFARNYDKDYTSAVEQVCLSTILCLIALPLMITLSSMILG